MKFKIRPLSTLRLSSFTLYAWVIGALAVGVSLVFFVQGALFVIDPTRSDDAVVTQTIHFNQTSYSQLQTVREGLRARSDRSVPDFHDPL